MRRFSLFLSLSLSLSDRSSSLPFGLTHFRDSIGFGVQLMRAVGQAQLRLDKALKEKTDSSPSTAGEKVEETKKALEERTSPREEAEKGKTK